MSRAEWSRDAESDLVDIWNYIGKRGANPDAADRLIDDIRDKASRYAENPGLGTSRNDLGPDVRVFPVRKNYIVVYTAFEDGIRVLRVFEGHRDYSSLF